MAHSVLHASDAFWRPSTAMGVLNTDLARQLGAADLRARLWRLRPGEASTRHRHVDETELYVVLSGEGRMRVGEEVLTLEPLSAVLVEPCTLRQVFNDTDRDAVWLIVGAPPEAPEAHRMLESELADVYPAGRSEPPPQLTVVRS